MGGWWRGRATPVLRHPSVRRVPRQATNRQAARRPGSRSARQVQLRAGSLTLGIIGAVLAVPAVSVVWAVKQALRSSPTRSP